MKFYRDLFEASLNRVLPENDKKRFFEAFRDTFIHMSPETERHFSRRPGDEGLRLPPRFFALWREAMLRTVRASDPLCDEEILTAWAMAIAPGLEYVRRQAELHYQVRGE
ncbi:globin [Salmonella enterica]|nr:globin [Salmonella enterica]